MELKVLRKLAEEQRSAMEEYRQGLKRCLNSLSELQSTTVYSQQNKEREGEGYKRELHRLQ
jgi:hypothetical protein